MILAAGRVVVDALGVLFFSGRARNVLIHLMVGESSDVSWFGALRRYPNGLRALVDFDFADAKVNFTYRTALVGAQTHSRAL